MGLDDLPVTRLIELQCEQARRLRLAGTVSLPDRVGVENCSIAISPFTHLQDITEGLGMPRVGALG